MGALNRFSTVLPLALLLAAAPLSAQDAPEPETNGTATEAPVDEASESDVATAPATPAPDTDDSPFDYESSEQISEDLSVSFPVDI